MLMMWNFLEGRAVLVSRYSSYFLYFLVLKIRRPLNRAGVSQGAGVSRKAGVSKTECISTEELVWSSEPCRNHSTEDTQVFFPLHISSHFSQLRLETARLPRPQIDLNVFD